MNRALLVLLSWLVLTPSLASATPISLVQNSGDAVALSVSLSGTVYSVSAGQFTGTWLSGTPSGYSSTFYSYCVDLLNAVVNPQDVTIRSTNLLTVSGVPNAGGKAAWLFNNYAATVYATGAAADKAALQLAIWEAIYDTSYSAYVSSTSNTFTTGNFQKGGLISTTVMQKASTFLAALYSASNANGYYTSTATWLDTDLGQDQITFLPTPEPATLTLLALGLGGAARAVRRRRRQVA